MGSVKLPKWIKQSKESPNVGVQLAAEELLKLPVTNATRLHLMNIFGINDSESLGAKEAELRQLHASVRGRVKEIGDQGVINMALEMTGQFADVTGSDGSLEEHEAADSGSKFHSFTTLSQVDLPEVGTVHYKIIEPKDS